MALPLGASRCVLDSGPVTVFGVLFAVRHQECNISVRPQDLSPYSLSDVSYMSPVLRLVLMLGVGTRNGLERQQSSTMLNIGEAIRAQRGAKA